MRDSIIPNVGISQKILDHSSSSQPDIVSW